MPCTSPGCVVLSPARSQSTTFHRAIVKDFLCLPKILGLTKITLPTPELSGLRITRKETSFYCEWYNADNTTLLLDEIRQRFD